MLSFRLPFLMGLAMSRICIHVSNVVYSTFTTFFVNVTFYVFDVYKNSFWTSFTSMGVDVCMGMGKTGIPWVPRHSHGNGN